MARQVSKRPGRSAADKLMPASNLSREGRAASSAQQGQQGQGRSVVALPCGRAPGPRCASPGAPDPARQHGALIVPGDGPAVARGAARGLRAAGAFSATRLRELAKMDGAVVLDATAGDIVRVVVRTWSRIRRCPPTSQAPGTAPRNGSPGGTPAARSSQSASRCGSSGCTWGTAPGTCWRGRPRILSRANQAWPTLERYKLRLDEVSRVLTAHNRGHGHRPGRDRGRPAARDGPPHRR